MAYLVEFKAEALSGLERLSQKNQERVLRKIRWLTENFEQLTPQALTGDLSSLFNLRIGDYRALYSFNDETEIITIHRLGHRREIYLYVDRSPSPERRLNPMTTKLDEKSFISFKRHLADYLPQLERAIAAIKTLEVSDPNSEAFSQAFADLHVASTVLEPYSEGMREVIDQFTEDRPDEA